MIEAETFYRLIVFFSIFALVALLELIIPRRPKNRPVLKRWGVNFGILFLGSLLVRVIIPWAAIDVAYHVERLNWGLFHYFAFSKQSVFWDFFLGFLLLDLAIYFQHRVFHQIPWLWRLHSVHHLDRDLDVSSGNRFHPLEILLSMFIKIGLVIFFGISAWSVLVFEIVLNASSMFNHGNFRISNGLERPLRRLIITPDFHRIHHSVYPDEMNSNFGFFLSIWDWTFGTALKEPKDGQLGMVIGLDEYHELKWVSLKEALVFPFKKNEIKV